MPYNFDVEKAIKSFHKEFGKENKELNAQQVFYALSLFTTHHLVKDIRDTLMSNKITLEEYALFTRGMGLLPENLTMKIILIKKCINSLLRILL